MDIGILSDTHGLMRQDALSMLRGVSLIIHAGDIGTPQVIQQLETIAPVVAVRGNTDQGVWAYKLPTTEVVEREGISLYVLHNIAELNLDPAAAGFKAVIFGHSHKPLQEIRKGVLFLNPGSAGPKRFKLPVTMALISIKENQLIARIVGLGS